MNIIIGQAARGDKFYIRKNLINRLWRKIDSGTNILMSAPRRIGKTSIMLHCSENPSNNCEVIYLITESVNNKNEFYKKLMRVVHEQLTNSKKVGKYLQNLVKSTKIKSIGPEGISFDSVNESNYYDEFVTIAEQIGNDGCKLILMVDEFAQTVENITQDEGDNSAINFLESVREIRINPRISNKIQFVFAGSIGLENIVSQLNSTSTINDLYSFKVTPFTDIEAIDYIRTIALKEGTYKFTLPTIKYLLKKLEWNIPYFINIILDEIEQICDDKNSYNIKKATVDLAFQNALKNRTYFEHWHNRLRKAFKQNDYNFSKRVLNLAAENSLIATNDITNIAVELDILLSYKDIIHALEFDGYINNQIDPKTYVFNSPLLKQWWLENVAN